MKHRLLAALRGVVFMVLVALLLVVFFLAASYLHGKPAQRHGEPGPLQMLVGESLQILSVAGATALMLLWRDQGEPALGWGGRFLVGANLLDRQWLRRLIAGLGFGVLSAAVLIGGIALCGGFSISLPASMMGVRAGHLGLYALVFMLVGAFEETAFRGYLLRAWSTAFGFPLAAILTSVVFGATHLLGGTPLIGAVQAGLAGAALVAMFYRTGSLWFPIGWHAAWDWMESGVFGVADSGHVMPGALLQTVPHGPVWLTGGADGPEGSVLCTFMMVALALAFWLVPRRPISGGSLPAP